MRSFIAISIALVATISCGPRAKQVSAKAPPAKKYVSEVYFSKNEDREPVKTFKSSDDKIVGCVLLQNLESAKTITFRSEWVYVKGPKGTNSMIYFSEIEVEITPGTYMFTSTMPRPPNGSFPPGEYRLDIYVAGVLDDTGAFTVN